MSPVGDVADAAEPPERSEPSTPAVDLCVDVVISYIPAGRYMSVHVPRSRAEVPVAWDMGSAPDP
jgi:hypothetical protein